MKEKANNQVLFEQVRAIDGKLGRRRGRWRDGGPSPRRGAARARDVFERGRRAVTTNDARSKDGNEDDDALTRRANS